MEFTRQYDEDVYQIDSWNIPWDIQLNDLLFGLQAYAGGDAIDNFKMVKLLKDAGVLADHFTSSDVDVLFSKVGLF